MHQEIVHLNLHAFKGVDVSGKYEMGREKQTS